MTRDKSLRRYDVLTAIRRNERATIRELCDACGIKAPSQVYGYLNQLEEEGLLYRLQGARQIYLGKRPEGLAKRTVKKRHESHALKPRILHNPKGVLRKDPGLDARINAVVAKARQRELTPGGDVIRGGRWVLHLDGVKASRVG